MRLEKIIKRADGRRFNIMVTAYIDFDKIKYTVYVAVCEPGKKKFNSLVAGNSYNFRSLSLEEREKESNRIFLEHVTVAEIQAAKLELWQTMKPENPA